MIYYAKKIIWILSVMFLLVACGGYQINQKDVIIKEIPEERVMDQFYEYESVEIEVDVFMPSSIVFFEDNLYILDQGNDRIIVFDEENTIKVLGKSGSNEVEFISPSSMFISEDGIIYVGDSGNERIQIIDQEGKYIDSIPIPNIEKETDIIKSIGLSQNGNIYYTTETSEEKNLGAFKISEEKECEKIFDEFWGDVIVLSNNIYLISQGYWDKEDESYMSGESYIVKVDETNNILEYLYELPGPYCPLDIDESNDNIYCLSNGYSCIDIFNKNLTYISTAVVESFESTTGWIDIAVNMNGDIYVIDALKSKLIKYEKRIVTDEQE